VSGDGDIPSAWTYFKAIGEPGPLRRHRKYHRGENLDRIIEIAIMKARTAQGFRADPETA